VRLIPWLLAAGVVFAPARAQAHMTQQCAAALLRHDVAVAALFMAKHREADRKRPSEIGKPVKEAERRTNDVQRACGGQDSRQGERRSMSHATLSAAISSPIAVAPALTLDALMRRVPA